MLFSLSLVLLLHLFTSSPSNSSRSSVLLIPPRPLLRFLVQLRWVVRLQTLKRQRSWSAFGLRRSSLIPGTLQLRVLTVVQRFHSHKWRHLENALSSTTIQLSAHPIDHTNLPALHPVCTYISSPYHPSDEGQFTHLSVRQRLIVSPGLGHSIGAPKSTDSTSLCSTPIYSLVVAILLLYLAFQALTNRRRYFRLSHIPRRPLHRLRVGSDKPVQH